MDREIRKGAADAIENYLAERPASFPLKSRPQLRRLRAPAARRWWLRKDRGALGVIQLKDIVKGGMRERFSSCAPWDSTVMITGDNPLTAAAIAREAGVDDFLAQARRKTRWI